MYFMQWILIVAQGFSFNKDICLCLVYVHIARKMSTHVASKDKNIEPITEEIATFSNVGDIILVWKDLPKWQHVSYDWWEYASKSEFHFRMNMQKDYRCYLHLVYSNSITQYRRKRNYYACFIDFTKAFDSVSHSLLWKMSSLGSSRKLKHWKSFITMYSKATARVIMQQVHYPILQGRKAGM